MSNKQIHLLLCAVTVLFLLWIVLLSLADRQQGLQLEAGGTEYGDKIDLNTADAELLCELPGIGGTLAERIIESRSADGAFAEAAEVMRVTGIGEAKWEAMRPYVTAMPLQEGEP